MASVVPDESADDVLASIRRIVSEEASPSNAGTTAQVSPDRSDAETTSPRPDVKDQERRHAAFIAARDRLLQNASPQLTVPVPAPETSKDHSLCKLLLTEDFQVRGPDQNRIAHPVSVAALNGYSEDSDMLDSGLKAKSSIETAIRGALQDSVRAALDGALQTDDSALTDDDGFIDAETLRALVINIVHEELRGELGSQITARVRKLVRQEINRALQVNTINYL